MSEKNESTLRKTPWLCLLVLLGLMLSCVPENKGTGRRSVDSQGANTSEENDDNQPDSPDFEDDLNSIQAGSQRSSSSLSIPTSYDDSIYLRGEQVNHFIKNDNTDAIQCLVVPFPNSNQNKVGIFAATPRFFINFSTNTKEYYYLISPNEKTDNQALCQKASLVNQVNIEYGTSDLSFALSEICTNCSSSDLNSDGLKLYAQSGSLLDRVRVDYLRLRLNSNPSSDDSSSGSSCESSSECQAKGFDCCSAGQCVNDKQLKNGVDQNHADFLQALADIENNPSNITDYPEYYHLCSVAPPSEPTEPDPIDAEDDARKRFTRLQELHECTTLQEGEMSICTLNIDNASEQDGPFFTSDDDRNFNSTYRGTTGLLEHSIVKMEYAGLTLFDDGAGVPLNGATIGANQNGDGNDNLGDPLEFDLETPLPSNAPNDILKVKYKIDGSCEQISSNLGQCKKFYVQGQDLGRIDDHFPARNQFALPYYANINRSVSVKVDGAVKSEGTQWELIPGSPSVIEFKGTGLQVFDTETVEISFFVDLTVENALQAKLEAVEEIQNVCECVGPDCRLAPVVSSETGKTTDYKCVYPEPDLPPPPLQQTVMLNSKSTPHRFFDETGLAQEDVNVQTPKQEGDEFKYEDNNLLKPNNLNESKGFNEIYGSFTARSGSALPAKMVRVEKNRTYDIFTETGIFSTCLSCGNDYHSNLVKIFPESLGKPGAGYTPNMQRTDQSKATDYRSDDLIFGRACFVPASMIPWSHAPRETKQEQRLNRLATQHFYFSNGYQRDWFGFDYGSLIGSFDGVNWFSIGSQRRIKAKTNKLFIAINAYFGDLTVTNNFTVKVSDASTVPASGSTVTNDFESDGASCRQVHSCNTDRDCATKLGWDYTCQDIGNVTTPWPDFDSNASELPNLSKTERLKTLFNITSGGNKRCVYRGRGTPCQTNNTISDGNASFNSATEPGSITCSSNNYCQPFIAGSEAPRFNTKIARFARSVRNQNASTDVPESNLDSFGLGARVIGRPYKYNGDETVPEDVISNMSLNSIAAMCIPGRNPQAPTLSDQHNSVPTSQNTGDKVLGMGVTPSSDQSLNYTSACSIFDTDGNYYSFKKSNLEDLTLGNPSASRLQALSAGQVIPTNALKIFEGLTNESLIKRFETETIEDLTLEENRCLRAPGSACHTDLDCAPSNYVTNITRLIDATDEEILANTLNLYEILFWQEPLICGQEFEKDHEEYDLTNNRCCRPTDSLMRIGTVTRNAEDTTYGPDLSHFEAPRMTSTGKTAIDTDLSGQRRNSRLAPLHLAREVESNGQNRFPALETARDNTCDTADIASCRLDKEDLNLQFNSVDELASKTCCSKNWIRHWDSTDNGGGHRWEISKIQNINKSNFACKNWTTPARTCSGSAHPDDPDCFARSVPGAEADAVLAWMTKFELLGIPQVAIESDTFPGPQFPDLYCEDGSGDMIPNFVHVDAKGEYEDADARVHLSATNEDNFNEDLKQIFSKDEFSCCLPTGTEVPEDSDRDACCSGFINGRDGTCALPDFTNVSLYFNRYVSSEANHLDDSVFNSSGYIKSPSTVEQLACQQKTCASGILMRGVAYSPLKVRGHEDKEENYLRFLDGNDQANNFSGLADFFDGGIRWNNQVYCAPENVEVEDSSVFVFQCP